ncbi:MAG: 5-formyltetrahydrofolate cyclo-ligase [Flavobacteriales bacterium]
MDKETLRKIYLARRKALSPQEVSWAGFQALSRLEKLPIWDKSCYHIFLSIQKLNELHTQPIIDRLFALGRQVVIPRSNFSKLSMESCIWTRDEPLQLNAYEIHEPLGDKTVDPFSIDVIFVPLLVFDKEGYRVGYGKGFYDRFLTLCRADVLKIGLSLFDPLDQITDIHSADVSLNVAISPKEVHIFDTALAEEISESVPTQNDYH